MNRAEPLSTGWWLISDYVLPTKFSVSLTPLLYYFAALFRKCNPLCIAVLVTDNTTCPNLSTVLTCVQLLASRSACLSLHLRLSPRDYSISIESPFPVGRIKSGGLRSLIHTVTFQFSLP